MTNQQGSILRDLFQPRDCIASNCHGLLDEQRTADLEAGRRQLGMEVIGHRDHDEVRGRGGEIGQRRDMRLELACQPRRLIASADDRADPGAVDRVQGAREVRALESRTNDCNLDHGITCRTSDMG